MEQTKTKPQGTVEFKMKKQMQTFSFNPRIKFAEQDKWLLTVTSFETTNSVFNITNGNISFSISMPIHWNSEDGEEVINELKKLLELRSQNDVQLHVKEVEKEELE